MKNLWYNVRVVEIDMAAYPSWYRKQTQNLSVLIDLGVRSASPLPRPSQIWAKQYSDDSDLMGEVLIDGSGIHRYRNQKKRTNRI